MLAGTVADTLLELKLILSEFPAGTGPLRVTVAVEVPAPTKELGLRTTLETTSGCTVRVPVCV